MSAKAPTCTTMRAPAASASGDLPSSKALARAASSLGGAAGLGVGLGAGSSGLGFGLGSGLASGLGSGSGFASFLIAACAVTTGAGATFLSDLSDKTTSSPASRPAASGIRAGACDTVPDTTGAADASGAVLLRSGMVMGMSTATGRGWVSNSSGKPTTPTSTSTAAPIRRWRARLRMTSTLSGGAEAADRSSRPFMPGKRKLKNAMGCYEGEELGET